MTSDDGKGEEGIRKYDDAIIGKNFEICIPNYTIKKIVVEKRFSLTYTRY